MISEIRVSGHTQMQEFESSLLGVYTGVRSTGTMNTPRFLSAPREPPSSVPWIEKLFHFTFALVDASHIRKISGDERAKYMNFST